MGIAVKKVCTKFEQATTIGKYLKSVGWLLGDNANYSKSQSTKKRYFSGKNDFYWNFLKTTPEACLTEGVYKI